MESPENRQQTNRETSRKILDSFIALHPKLIDLSLDRVTALLERLGNPHENLPPVIHVAGTNGKGSTIAYMRAALEAAGYSVHVHISPHLVRFNERIRLAGELIEEDDLISILKECETANGGEQITFFEITTVAALLAFSRYPADVVLLETGLGGRLDATNVVPNPALTVITPISLDHQSFLGDTLAEIAGEKAGILKPGAKCLIGNQPTEVSEVIRRRATEVGVEVLEVGVDWNVGVGGQFFTYQTDGQSRKLPFPNLIGDHQIDNAALAVAALDQLTGFEVHDAALAHGLTHAEWPARLQHLKFGPLLDKLPSGSELWLDGGHNVAAALTIRAQMENWAKDGRDIHLVCGMLNTKDASAFLKPIGELAANCLTVAIPGEENSFSADDLAGKAVDAGVKAISTNSVEAALSKIAADNSTPVHVLICGSLYLAGTVLEDNG